MENQTVNDGKTIAIISYLWWIGLIIAFISNWYKRNLKSWIVASVYVYFYSY